MPPKPRPQGPRKRTDGGGGVSVDRRLLGIGAAAAIALAGIIVGVVLASGGDGKGGGSEASARTALEAAGCELKVVKALAGDHSIADPDDTSKKWNTDPPTSGPHYAETLIYGSYTEPIQQARALHNLEHGAITIQYGKGVSEETVAELQAFYDDNRNGTILAPKPDLGDTIALAAWNAPNTVDDGNGILATCEAYDEPAFTAYFDAFQFKGPERFSPSAMAPGSN